jgi:carboxyl-terminal processing protease
MSKRDPEKNFTSFWKTFHKRYPFFELRKVDWKKQYEKFRPKVAKQTSDEELFGILCAMIDPLDDGHVGLEARIGGKKRRFTSEKTTKFEREFTPQEIKKLFETSENTLASNGFGSIARTEASILRYGRSKSLGYLRIVELEGVNKRRLTAALSRIVNEFRSLEGFIIDVRDCPGGEDSLAIMIINRFCDRKRIAFHRRTKIGPGKDDFTPLRTWYLEPMGEAQFTGPIVVLTNDSVFSGGEAFALAIRELPHVTIMGDRTNGIFSYTLDRTLPNGWKYFLSYQVYYSAEMACYEGVGVPVDIELLNKNHDLDRGVDPLIESALRILSAGVRSR